MRFKSFVDTHNTLQEHASLLVDTFSRLDKRERFYNFVIECLLESSLFEAEDEDGSMANPGLAKRFRGSAGANRAEKRRTWSDEEWQHGSDIIRGNREALKKKNKGKEPELFGRGYGSAKAMRHVLQTQEPAIAAWEKLGIDANPQQVQLLMKSSGQQVLPDPKYKDYLGIKYLNELRQKSSSGQRLLGREQQIMQKWEGLSSQKMDLGGGQSVPSVVGKNLQGSTLLSPDQFYQKLKDEGVEVISDEEAELKYLELVQQDIISGRAHVTDPSIKDPDRKFQKSMTKWWGTNTHGANPDDVSIPNNLEAGKDLPDPFIGMGTDSKNAPDDEVLAQYDANPKLYSMQIIKPACMGTASQLLSIWKRSGQEGPLPITSKSLPDPMSANPPCGLTGNEPAIAKIDNWLEPHGTFYGILQHVIDGLKNATNMREKDGSRVFGAEVGQEKENLRFTWAKLFAWHALQKIYRAMERDKRVKGNIQGRAGAPSPDGGSDAVSNMTAQGVTGTEKQNLKKSFAQYLPQLKSMMKPNDVDYFQELMTQLKQANKDQKMGVPGYRQSRAEALEGLRDLIDAYPQIEELLSKAMQDAATETEDEEEPVA